MDRNGNGNSMGTGNATANGLLVSAAVAASDGARLLQAAEQAGRPAELLLLDPAQPLSDAALARMRCALLSVDIIGQSTKERVEPLLAAFSDAVRRAPALEWMQVCSAGMDRPLYGELRSRGVKLASGAGTNALAVAQNAITGVLALARGLPHWVAAQREHRWAPLRGALTPTALEGQRALVVGTGAIGRNIARLLKALDLQVTGVRRSPADSEFFDEMVGYEQIDQVLPQADWLILVCPLTDITRGLIDARRLALLPPGARLLNLARGEVVQTEPLVEALRGGGLGGAYLDVFEREPLPPDSPLWDLPNVLLSAHCAGNSTGHQRNVVQLFMRNLARAARGERLENAWLP